MVHDKEAEGKGGSTNELVEDLLTITTIFVARNNEMWSAENRRKWLAATTGQESQIEEEEEWQDSGGEGEEDLSLSHQKTSSNSTQVVWHSMLDL